MRNPHLALAVAAVALAGCAPQIDPAEQAERNLLAIQEAHDLACVKGFPRLRVGMTQTDVLRIMLPCTKDRQNTTQTAAGVREQWVFTSHLGGAFEPQYLYFDGERLEAIQRSE